MDGICIVRHEAQELKFTADRSFPIGLGTAQEKYTETITIRVTKQDLTLLQKICKARGEDASGFLRRAMRVEFAKLGFLSEEEKQALGLHQDNMETPHSEKHLTR